PFGLLFHTTQLSRLCLCFGTSLACGSVLKLPVNFTSHQNNEAGHKEPQQQNHPRPQAPVGLRTAIEEMQVHPEQKRGSQPQQNSKHRTGCDPVPVLLFLCQDQSSRLKKRKDDKK